MIASMTWGHCLVTLEMLIRNLQFPHKVPFNKGENASVPLPLKNKIKNHTGLQSRLYLVGPPFGSHCCMVFFCVQVNIELGDRGERMFIVRGSGAGGQGGRECLLSGEVDRGGTSFSAVIVVTTTRDKCL